MRYIYEKIVQIKYLESGRKIVTMEEICQIYDKSDYVEFGRDQDFTKLVEIK